MSGDDSQKLDMLAGELGVTRSYHDGTGQFRRASDEAVLAVVRALGAPAERIEDAGDALRVLEDARSSPSAPAVALAPFRSGSIVRLAAGAQRPRQATLVLESGEQLDMRVLDTDSGCQIHVSRETPAGCHRLELDGGGNGKSVLVVVAPERLPEMPRSWCAFAPLYALRQSTGGFASYADLVKLGEWIAGGRRPSDRHRDVSLLGTLPLLACFFEEPFEPSPYSPISRSFWSEIYVDPAHAPEAALLARTECVPSAPGTGRADYRRTMKERRHQIEALLAALEGSTGARRDAFERMIEEDRELASYAAFRAAVELYGSTWERWPARARDGLLRAGVDYDGETFRYHVYAQWLAREQLENAARQSPAGLYLDLPLGSHAGGYDTWRYADEFVRGVSVGAPPDAVFEGGQDWGFPPMHPERAREAGYAALRAALRHHFSHAALVRVDHVMGLHRSFWIPDGFTAADGVYVRSRKDELWAMLSAAAACGRGGGGTPVVGEDLGTVPDEVREEMHRRGALRMHVVPFECGHDAAALLREPPRESLACLGTHDMEPFATWWDGPAAPRDAIASSLQSNGSAADALPKLLSWLARSDATVACVNLEDLWLERERQNLPGSPAGDVSWQRQFARTTEDFTTDPRLRALLDVARGAASSGAAEAPAAEPATEPAA